MQFVDVYWWIFQLSCRLKADPQNMKLKLITLDVSHFEIPLLNFDSQNIYVISVTLDTFHFPLIYLS